MRAERSRSALVRGRLLFVAALLVGIAFAPRALAQPASTSGDVTVGSAGDGSAPGDPPAGEDPTLARPVPTGPLADDGLADEDDATCAADARCRLARFRDARAARRRQLYLRRVDEAARAMDRETRAAMPWRTRWRFDVNLLLWSNWGMGGVVAGVAPTWWLRLEGYVGYFTHDFNDYQPVAMTYGSTGGTGVHAGSQLRLLPIKWALTPYASVGWGYLTGSAHYSFYGFGKGNAGNDGSMYAHLFTAGAGLELILPWFHCAVGYQLAYAFFAEGQVANRHDDGLTAAVHANLDNAMHGVNVQLGVAF